MLVIDGSILKRNLPLLVSCGSFFLTDCLVCLHSADQEKERLVDEVEEKEIRNTELLIEIETLEEEILQLDERLLQLSKAADPYGR